VSDSVAVDAKRILLRYGAPIVVLDKISEAHRIEFAREIAKTELPERELRLHALLVEHGYLDSSVPPPKVKRKRK
jgi:hypothetical protein